MSIEDVRKAIFGVMYIFERVGLITNNNENTENIVQVLTSHKLNTV